jgi:hypothetical protein
MANDTRFKAGAKRPPGAGRKKGTPNKATAAFRDVLGDHNFSPAEELIKVYKASWSLYEKRRQTRAFGAAVDALKLCAKIADDVAQYTYPKLKAVEHTGEVRHRTFADFMRAGLEEPKTIDVTPTKEGNE